MTSTQTSRRSRAALMLALASAVGCNPGVVPAGDTGDPAPASAGSSSGATSSGAGGAGSSSSAGSGGTGGGSEASEHGHSTMELVAAGTRSHDESYTMVFTVGQPARIENKTWDEAWKGNAGSPQNDPAGNDRRDWRIGFRCAYDGP